MNLDQQVMEVLRRHAPGLLSAPVEDNTERRRELLEQLEEIETGDLAKVRECEAKVKEIETRQAQLKEELEAAEKAFSNARWQLSGASAIYSERRNAVWKALESVPSEEMTNFRREVEGRLTDVDSWSRTWTGAFNREIGRPTMTGNSASVFAYSQALLHTQSLVTNAIREGLDGKDAEAAIAAMRSQWPQVQVGPNEYITPAWNG